MGRLFSAFREAALRFSKDGCGFLAQAIASQDQSPPAAVPERESEHAPQLVDKLEVQVLVEMDQHLAIAAGA